MVGHPTDPIFKIADSSIYPHHPVDPILLLHEYFVHDKGELKAEAQREEYR